MKNPFKRNDVFTCHYARHAAFANHVSAYHVLVAKRCYPQGCLEFKWSCALLSKGKRCSRGFSRMGRLCSGCAHYRDEKVHYQPRIHLTPAEFARFQQDLAAFEEWVEENQGREKDVTFRIDSLKPRFIKEIDSHGARLRLEGYLLIAREGFIGRDAFEDYFYAVLTPAQQERLALARGDELDARGAFSLDQGRILFPRLRAIEVSLRSGEATWSNSQALVAKQSARPLGRQPEQCQHCRQGALVDVIDRSGRQERRRRELICLEGINSESSCYFQALQELDMKVSGCAARQETIF
jgi:hypothetical protein